MTIFVHPHSDESHFRSPTWHLCCLFLEFEYDAPCLLISVNVLLSSVATFCLHFLFTENSFDFWYDSGKTFATSAKSFDSFAILSSRNDPFRIYAQFTHAIFLSGSTANGVWVCMFERRKD